MGLIVPHWRRPFRMVRLCVRYGVRPRVAWHMVVVAKLWK